MLVARHASAVLLVQRPASGIWGGLWCLPEFDDRDAAEQFASRQLSSARLARAPLPEIEHSFTHFDLVITPIEVRCRGRARERSRRAVVRPRAARAGRIARAHQVPAGTTPENEQNGSMRVAEEGSAGPRQAAVSG